MKRHRAAGAILACLAALLSLSAASAWANDRPFQEARTAVMEEDEPSWSFETWVQRYGSVRGLSIEPEYAWDAHTSVQVELTRLTDRSGAETGHEGEVEFKYLFNDIVRDEWGWGISATLAAERLGRDAHTEKSVSLKVPLSVSLLDGQTLVHLNAGIEKASGSRRTWLSALAIEHEVFKRTVLFAEVAHEGEARFAQFGARYWLRHDKLAIDLALQQHRSEGQRASGFILAVGWNDL